MKTWTFRTLALSAALATLGVVVVSAGAASGDEGEGGDGFPRFFGRHAPCAHQLVEDLSLSPTQQAHVDNIRTLLRDAREARWEGRGEHLGWIIERVQQRDADGVEARAQIDARLEALRLLAYDVVDEVVVLSNSLDEEQRQLVVTHLENLQTRLEGNHGRGWLHRLHAWHGGHGGH